MGLEAVTVYVDALVQWGAPGQYRGPGSTQAERVGARNGHMWCHMWADEPNCVELHDVAQKIGLKRAWFQGNHYDLTPARRALAVRAGAIEATSRYFARKLRGWRGLPCTGSGS